MVVHTCERCNKEFDRKTNFTRHLGKKNQCKEVVQINIPILGNLPDDGKKNEQFDAVCEYCKNTYSNKYKLKRHIQICKVKINNDIAAKFANLEEKINILETKTKKTKNAQNIIINNNGVINNNNITNIANFGTLDKQKIGNKIFYHTLMNYSGYKTILKFIEYVHKNEKLKEYQNVEITDLGRNLGRICTDNEWRMEDANEITDKIIDEGYDYYEIKFDELEDEIDEKLPKDKLKIQRNKRFIFCMIGNEMFSMNDDGDYVDDDGVKVSENDFKNGKEFEKRLKKKVKMLLKKENKL